MQKKISKQELEAIWQAVPPDYYQQGVKKNLLQRTWHTGKLSTVISLIEKTPKKILDVGSASGWFLSQLQNRFPNALCTGIDVYEDAIVYGKKTYPKLILKKADGHIIPEKDQSFDCIVCCEVLEHVVDPMKVLTEIKRVLTKDGVAIIEMDSGNVLFQLNWYWWTHLRHGVWEDAHIQVYNAKRLEQEILDAGFTITKKKMFNLGMAVAFQVTK